MVILKRLNGVTAVPYKIAAEMADIEDEFGAAEKVILDVLRGNAPDLKALEEATAETGARIDGSRARVSWKNRQRPR